MIKISGFYISPTGSLIQLINICRCRENSQDYMLDNTDYNNISIDIYKQEILPTFMLALCELIKGSLLIVYV